MDSVPELYVGRIDLDKPKDWDDLFATYWESWKDPLQVTGLLTFPWLGEGSPRELASYNAAREAYLEQARHNPDQCWLKVEGRSVVGGTRIIGGGAFTVVREAATKVGKAYFESNSVVNDPNSLPEIELPGMGYPVGSERNVLMRQLYSQMWNWRPRIMMDRPHMYGHAIWVIPAYRHLGAAVKIMDWWLEQADILSLECFLEGSAIATPLYLQKGFVLLERPVMAFRHFPSKDEKELPSKEWKRLVHGLHVEPIAIMWRPVKGDYEEGKTVLPWLGRPRGPKL